MKQYIKTYFITFLISAFCIVFPWALALFGILTEMAVLEFYAIAFAVIALAITIIYVIRKVKALKPRLLIILLNPAIYYIIAVIIILIMLASESWSGFDLT